MTKSFCIEYAKSLVELDKQLLDLVNALGVCETNFDKIFDKMANAFVEELESQYDFYGLIEIGELFWAWFARKRDETNDPVTVELDGQKFEAYTAEEFFEMIETVRPLVAVAKQISYTTLEELY